MDFTFGIITDGLSDNNLNYTIDTIEKENIPNYEIIIVGNTNINRLNTTVISFDENILPKWITRKKNIITHEAKYENIVYMHDYIYLMEGWYEGHIKFGDDFVVLMDKIINFDDTRFRDWCLYDVPFETGRIMSYEISNPNLNKYIYISGSYWVAKKDLMLEFPLNESLVWNQAEDIEWSYRVNKKYNFKMNINSSVKLLKFKDNIHRFSTEEDNEKLKNF